MENKMSDQRLKNTTVFFFDVENTIYEVIRPGIKAMASFLPAVAGKLGIHKDILGQEIGRALTLEYKVAAHDVVHLSPTVIKKAGVAGYLDAEAALPLLDRIYATSGNEVKDLITAFDTLYKPAIVGRPAMNGAPAEKGLLSEEHEDYQRVSKQDIQLYPYISELLQELRDRGFPVICLSSQNVKGLAPHVAAQGVDKHADLFISAANDMSLAPQDQWDFTPAQAKAGLSAPHIVFPGAGMIKKHPQGFGKVASLLGIDLSQAAMIGDNLPEDIASMQKHGGLGILAGWGDTRADMAPLQNYHWYFAKAIAAGRQTTPDIVFDQPLDLIQRIRDLDLKGDPTVTSAFQKTVATFAEQSGSTAAKNNPVFKRP
jgi:phosphoglycolate phosphatase-like HAD superfamily hydrolase